jgi:hypothetical protein
VFTLANFARDFALSLHILLNKNYLFSLLNVRNHARNCASVNAPLLGADIFGTFINCLGIILHRGTSMGPLSNSKRQGQIKYKTFADSEVGLLDIKV